MGRRWCHHSFQGEGKVPNLIMSTWVMPLMSVSKGRNVQDGPERPVVSTDRRLDRRCRMAQQQRPISRDCVCAHRVWPPGVSSALHANLTCGRTGQGGAGAWCVSHKETAWQHPLKIFAFSSLRLFGGLSIRTICKEVEIQFLFLSRDSRTLRLHGPNQRNCP